MPNNPNFNYNARTFLDIRTELINYVQTYYPDSIADFTENDLGMLFLELIAGGADILSYQTDRAFQETQLENAQLRKSLLSIAKNMGFAVPGKRGSVTVVDFSVRVPAKGDTYAPEYTPIIKSGTQVIGGGQAFELIDDVDFSTSVSNFGYPNITIIPNIDANQVVQNYTLTKREVVYNGSTKIFNKVITPKDYKPFLSIVLPDTNVVAIEQIIVIPGINNPTPTTDQFYNPNFSFYQVDSLIQDRIFTDNPANTTNGTLKAGTWKKVTKKFIIEYTDKGFCKITFGGGNGDANAFADAMNAGGVFNGLDNYVTNTSLGEIPQVNNQLFIRYRVGGGANSNIGSSVLKTTGNVNITVNGPQAQINQQVIKSLTVNNPIPALGGADQPSIEMIRNLIAYNFSSQNRCITLNDYLVTVFKMPGQYGVPFRNNVFKKDNKVVIPILGLAPDGSLDNSSTSLLKLNIAEYLSQFRALNDYVEVTDGQIFNLAYDFSIYIDENIPSNEIAINVINTVINYHNIQNSQMNTDIFLGNLLRNIDAINGVFNIIDYTVYNKVGNGYSLNQMTQPYSNNDTNAIQLINNTLYSEPDSMFEIKYPNKDIRLFLKKKNQLNN